MNEKRTAPEKNSYQEAVVLMKKMGSKRGFNPIPPSQHERMMGKDQTPFTRVWGAMLHFTIGWGHRSPYAVDKDGKEMHVEHFAQLLEMDVDNARKQLDAGVDAGYWRKGAKLEGCRRWYLCGEVPPFEGEVETDPEKGMRIPFPSYILNPLNKLPPETQEEFYAEAEADAKLDKRLRADFDEARRTLFAQRQNTRLQRFGLPELREQQHTPKNPTVAAGRAEMRDRVKALIPLLDPLVERYAHTFSQSAQGEKNGSRTVEKNGRAGSATLLGLESDVEKAGRVLDDSQSGPQSRAETLPDEERSSVKQLPVPLTSAPRKRQAPEPPIDPRLTRQEIIAFAALADWQKEFKQCDFGEPVDARNKGQIVSVRALLEKLGGDMSFFPWAEKEKIPELGRRAMGKRAGPAGRFLGLLMDWATDFLDNASERARKEQEKRDAFARAAANSKALNKHLDQQAINAAIAELKDPTSTEAGRAAAREVLEHHGIQYGVEELKGAGS